jgi:hypothetical protein
MHARECAVSAGDNSSTVRMQVIVFVQQQQQVLTTACLQEMQRSTV